MAGFAWVTLATNDSYSLGALVLANSLRQVGTPHQLAVLVTPGVTNAMREQLRSVFNLVVEVNILDSKDEANLRLLQRPELGVTFTKLHCWRLTQYEKCVFLDADTLVLQNADELFDREELSAAPDVGWPDCFNSGVFVYRPSNETYENLVKFALERGSFDGGDQGLLNSYFSDWAHKDISKHLPFIYNMCSTACYSYLPAFKQFGSGAKIIHFIGPAKPWLQYFDTESRQVQPSPDLRHLQPVLQRWWDLFFSFIQPNLSSEMARSKSPAVHNPDTHPEPFYTSYPLSVVTYEPTANFDYTIIENESGPESDYKNVWDPWDEYEQKIEQPHNSSQFIAEPITNIVSGLSESHNTNAHSVVDVTPNIPDLPQPSQITIPAYDTPNEIQTEIFEIKPRTPSPPPQPKPKPHVEIIHIPVHNQYSHTNYPPVDIPTITHHIPSNHQNHAQPHEFEPPCTVANESTLHPNDTGSHDHDGDAGLAAAFSQLKLGEPRSPGQLALEDHLRRQGWEVGNIDYLGKDSFDNIWKKICETIDSAPKPKEPTPPPPVKESEVPSTVVEQKESQKPEQIVVQATETQPQDQGATVLSEAAAVPAPIAPVEAQQSEAAVPAETPSAPSEAQPTSAPPPVEESPQPVAIPVEAQPVVAPIEAQPVAAPIEAQPVAAPVEAQPVAAPAESPSESQAAAVAAEAQPPATPAEAQPAATPVETQPAATPVETQPAVTPVEAQPVAVPAETQQAAVPTETQPAAAAVPTETQPAVAAAPVEAQSPAVVPAETQSPATVSAEVQPAVEASAEPQPAVATPPGTQPAAEAQPAAAAPSETQPAAATPSETQPAAPLLPEAQPVVAPVEAPPVSTPIEAQPAAGDAPQAATAEVPPAAEPPAPVVSETSPPTTEQKQAVAPAAETAAEQTQPAVAPETPKQEPPAQEAAKAQPKAKGDSAKKAEAKPTPSEAAAAPTPPPRKAGTSPKKTKAKK